MRFEQIVWFSRQIIIIIIIIIIKHICRAHFRRMPQMR